MKQLQRLFASLLLACALAHVVAADDGIIHTGGPVPPPPPPPSAESPTQTGGETAEGDTPEGETSVLDAASTVALDFLCGVFTMF